MEGGMGFKNLHWFNLAMLAKQGWRILKNLESLIARLYKAVYYPEGDFSTVELGDRPSFPFCSICEARNVLLCGIRWQIGNGESVDIWRDCWLLDYFPRCPSSPPPRDAPKYVAELIDHSTSKWDVGILNQWFTPVDRDLILSIPLGRRASNDRNAQLWEGSRQHPSEASMVAMCWFNEFAKANTVDQSSRVHQRVWEAPENGWLKCNSDGSFLAAANRGGVGVVIRDHAGTFKAATMKQLDQVVSPFHAELLALYEGVKLAQALQYDKVESETDCLLLVHALKQEATDCSNLGFMLEEVKELLRGHVHYMISFVPRDANMMAHRIASHSLCNSDSQTWLIIAPEFIRDAILNECTC
ncbi:uncharacterized protein LOC121049178 [Rosa chinensis]|uniref:uncharacterized protein LOC121049178 n=1 Tax=Rosa chinensis TaxID=74649 RepID=UPI001AD8A3E8|nr:uncharacterized protein LOC121049178 [Rosa chinensis]